MRGWEYRSCTSCRGGLERVCRRWRNLTLFVPGVRLELTVPKLQQQVNFRAVWSFAKLAANRHISELVLRKLRHTLRDATELIATLFGVPPGTGRCL
jgi:hypothetical protein